MMGKQFQARQEVEDYDDITRNHSEIGSSSASERQLHMRCNDSRDGVIEHQKHRQTDTILTNFMERLYMREKLDGVAQSCLLIEKMMLLFMA
jgi:hypothetical protein